MSDLTPGWYILLYHDISWEEGPFVHGYGGTYPPDVFRDHVTALSNHGQFVSVDEGLAALESGAITRPMFTTWFDDGLAGVARYAAPLLAQYGTTGGYSMCSRFVLRKEMFWRFKLSYLQYVDGLKALRPKLSALGHRRSVSVKRFTLQNFSEEILSLIDETYIRFIEEADREDAFRIFETTDGIRQLKEKGWTIANHTAAHYPVGEDRASHLFKSQFDECEEFCQSVLGEQTRFWVLPFDRYEANNLLSAFQKCGGDRYLVLLGNRPNHQLNDQRILYRFAVPACTGQDLVTFLKK